jgi:hypothetical protein
MVSTNDYFLVDDASPRSRHPSVLGSQNIRENPGDASVPLAPDDHNDLLEQLA